MKRAKLPFAVPPGALIAASLLAVCGSSALADCDTPMAATVPVDQAAADPQQSAFLGIWNGTLQGSGGSVVCERIAVQHVDADGSAKLTFAYGSFSVPRGGGQPPLIVDAASRELVGHIDDDGLHFTSPSGTVYLVKADGSVTAKGAAGATGAGQFAKQ